MDFSEMLDEVTSFKYFGATLSKDGASTTEVQISIAMATAAMNILKKSCGQVVASASPQSTGSTSPS
ncbi:hypothetical protein DPMN_040838 [Dreissena polymorpha]|uniref:Uncharacterized protein n=1 Tax=Dreissena polymorpha TaxID=45954 RepID=A0A9D4CVT0_DREPO|nr:hypothetical protein DPMN_040838 [Dreissena polymorpha]